MKEVKKTGRTQPRPGPAAQKPAARAPKLTRQQKKEQIREALFAAAAAVVGEHGYSNAQVAMITNLASVAQGTFYNYFETQQDLLDQLLPTMGKSMLEFIKETSRDATSEFEREILSFRAFFEYLLINPSFYRILYEAEIFAPEAYRKHNEVVAKGYVRVLERAMKRGELKITDRKQLDPIAQMLMGARHYLCARFARDSKGARHIPEWVVDAYTSVVRGGVYR